MTTEPAAISAATQQTGARAGDGIPAGFALVPLEPTMKMVNAFHVTSDSDVLKRGYCRARWDAMLAAAPAVSAPAIEHDEQMGRDYIPLPGGWEVQTKGNGSTLRLLDKKAHERHPLPLPDHIVDFIERMAREIHAAGFQAPVTGDHP